MTGRALAGGCGASGQGGSATVLVTAVFAAVAALALLLGAIGGVLVGQRRVAAAADLAALAGAGAVQTGRDPCAAARVTARRNGGRLVRCRVAQEVVTVRVRRAQTLPLGWRVHLTGDAQAGPVGPETIGP